LAVPAWLNPSAIATGQSGNRKSLNLKPKWIPSFPTLRRRSAGSV
jgi:hypothetical protein